VQAALVEYQNRLQQLQSGLSQASETQFRALVLLAVTLSIVLLLSVASYSKRSAPAWLPPLFLAPAAWSLRRFFQIRRETSDLSRLQRFYRIGLDRLTGDWPGKGASGDEFVPTRHLYARDLNLFGAGSMFELLCTARTQVGRRRLASYLLDLPDRDETIERQEAVKELEPRCDLRERICLLGQYSFQSCDWEPFREWLESPAVAVPRGISWILPAISLALALMVLIPWLAPVNAGLGLRYRILVCGGSTLCIYSRDPGRRFSRGIPQRHFLWRKRRWSFRRSFCCSHSDSNSDRISGGQQFFPPEVERC